MLTDKLPVFIAVVVILAFLLLLAVFRSLPLADSGGAAACAGQGTMRNHLAVGFGQAKAAGSSRPRQAS